MMARWYMLLGQFSITFEYQLGAQHANADSLSCQCDQVILFGDTTIPFLLVIWVFPKLCIGCWTGYIGPASVRKFDHIWLAV